MARKMTPTEGTRTLGDDPAIKDHPSSSVMRGDELVDPVDALAEPEAAGSGRGPFDAASVDAAKSSSIEGQAPSASLLADVDVATGRDLEASEFGPVPSGPEEREALTLPDDAIPTSQGSLPPISQPRQAAPPRRGGAGALLLGGVLAGTVGFAGAWLARDRLGATTDELLARLAIIEDRPAVVPGADAAISRRLDEVEARLAALEERPAVSPIEAPPSANAETETLVRRLEDLDVRIGAIETRPTSTSQPATEPAPVTSGSLAGDILAVEPDAVQATEAPALDAEALRADVLKIIEPRLSRAEASLAALDARLVTTETASTQTAETVALAVREAADAEARADAATVRARGRAAVAALAAALDSGEPLAAALGDLDDADLVVPDALARLAETGAPTVAVLRETFPEAARIGLAAARADNGEAAAGEAAGTGLGGFLRRQFAIRSVAPRSGDDPDAILSRIEEALRQGRLSPALDEAGTLPRNVQDAMADWLGGARIRLAADAALADLGRALADRPATEATDAVPASDSVSVVD